MIGVIGMSVFGIAFAATVARQGFQTLLADTDEELVIAVQEHDFPGYEASLKRTVEEAAATGNLAYSGNVREVVKKCNDIFITAEVIADDDVETSIRFITEIVRTIAVAAEQHKTLIISSAVPPGTTDILRDMLTQMLKDRDVDFTIDLAVAPYFFRTGSMLKDINRPKSVAIGADTPEVKNHVRDIFSNIGIVASKMIYGSTKEVEVANYGLSAMLAIKTAFINDLASLCEECGANIETVTKIMGKDPRVSSQFMDANPGFGGSNIPRSAKSLIALSKQFGSSMEVLEGALAANEKHKEHCSNRIEKIFGSLDGKLLGISGLTLEHGTDDLRDSPAIDIIKTLVNKGAKLKIMCGACKNQAKWRLHNEMDSLEFVDDPYAVAEDTDGMIIFTKWPNTRAVDESLVREKMKGDILIDMQNVFSSRKEVQKLFNYYGIGM